MHRHYGRASITDSVPSIIRECLALLQSELFFLTLSNLTGLSLHPLAPASSDSEDEGEGSSLVPEADQSEASNGRTNSQSESCRPSSNSGQSGGSSQKSCDGTKRESGMNSSKVESGSNDDSIDMKEKPSPKKRKLNAEKDEEDLIEDKGNIYLEKFLALARPISFSKVLDQNKSPIHEIISRC